MKSNFVVAKHPLHPMLIPIPIASFLLALIGDLAYLGTNNPFWYGFAFWTMGIGIVGALLAAIPGFVDYFTIVRGEAKRFATIHMIANLSIVVVFAINLGIRMFTTATTGTNLWIAVALTVIGNLALLYSGWLGAHLVYQHRIAVREAEEYKENLRITLSPTEAERVERP